MNLPASTKVTTDPVRAEQAIAVLEDLARALPHHESITPSS